MPGHAWFGLRCTTRRGSAKENGTKTQPTQHTTNMASKCPTSASNMISTSSKFEPTASPTKQLMHSSGDSSKSEDFSDTNSPAGVPTTSPPEDLDSTKMSLTSQSQLKHGSEWEPSAISITNSASISFLSDEEYFSTPVFEMNHIHEMILDNIRQGNAWQQNLLCVHGFTEAEACECFSRAGKYLHCNEFPADAVNEKLFPHAKEGWILLQETDRLGKEYPRELHELYRRAVAEGKGPGVWE